MSSRNGDKSRFHRQRKQKIARRNRTHELLQQGSKAAASGERSTTARRQKAVSA